MINRFINRITIVVCVYMGALHHAFTQDNTVGARSAGLSDAGVMLKDFWAINYNQAGLAYLDNLSLGVSYNHGFIPVMGHRFAGLAVPAAGGTLAVSTSYYGYSKYYESKSGVAYAMMLGESLSSGIQIDYLRTHIAENYDSFNMLTFETGMLYKVNPEFSLGFHIFNPLNFQFSDRIQEIPAVFKLGGGYQGLNNFLLCAEVVKVPEHKPDVRLGIEYLILNQFYIRTGVSAIPFSNSFGIGYEWESIMVNLSFLRHNQLGYTSCISLHYNF
ncbi:MAG: hypothetical protein R6U04_04115 [Bacteroidales bacterium]